MNESDWLLNKRYLTINGHSYDHDHNVVLQQGVWRRGSLEWGLVTIGCDGSSNSMGIGGRSAGPEMGLKISANSDASSMNPLTVEPNLIFSRTFEGNELVATAGDGGFSWMGTDSGMGAKCSTSPSSRPYLKRYG